MIGEAFVGLLEAVGNRFVDLSLVFAERAQRGDDLVQTLNDGLPLRCQVLWHLLLSVRRVHASSPTDSLHMQRG